MARRASVPSMRGIFAIRAVRCGRKVAEGATEADRLQLVDADIAPDLGLVRASHRVDEIPVTDGKGVRVRRSFDDAVTHIRRQELQASLFDVPDDYTLAIGPHENLFVGFVPGQSPPACKP
jgi:hypothetical protein